VLIQKSAGFEVMTGLLWDAAGAFGIAAAEVVSVPSLAAVSVDARPAG
jgi:hypothetical protein